MKVTIISTDAVRIPLKKEHAQTVIFEGKKYDIKDKCCRNTALGTRAWKITEHLIHHPFLETEIDVTLLIPDLNYPGKENIDFSKINFKIEPYEYNKALWTYSNSLKEQLKDSDVIILQTASGIGFLNCTYLNPKQILILDLFEGMHLSVPYAIQSYPDDYKEMFWDRFIMFYHDLLFRADCLLYLNTRLKYFYEGVLFSINKLDYKTFQNKYMLKIPYGVEKNYKVIKNNDDTIKLVWLGPIYPWYDAEPLIEAITKLPNVQLDFKAAKHPRYIKSTNSNIYKLLDTENITLDEAYCDNVAEAYTGYDAGIILAKDNIEETYSNRCRILDMLSYGLPVITNQFNCLFEELIFLKDGLYGLNPYDIYNTFKNMKKQELIYSDKSFQNFQEFLSWDNVLIPLVKYINQL